MIFAVMFPSGHHPEAFFHVPVLSLIWYGLLLFCLTAAFSETCAETGYTTKDNYTGYWENPASWNPAWDDIRTDSIDINLSIYGYISCTEPLSFSLGADTLFVYDTLVVFGDLLIGNKSVVQIGSGGILLIMGDLIMENLSEIWMDTNAYTLITGNYINRGTGDMGSFYSNNEPANVFVGGSVQGMLNPLLFPVFSCPGNSPYDSSRCSYGNMDDMENDPVYSFFQSICGNPKPVITTSGPLSFCLGDKVILSVNEGESYLWSTGDTTQNIVVSASGTYSVSVVWQNECPATVSDEVVVRVNPLPTPAITISENSGLAAGDGIICMGETANLTAVGGIQYAWSTGETTAEIIKDTPGNYSVTVTDANGCSNSTQASISVITVEAFAGNDGEVCGQSYTPGANVPSGSGVWSVSPDADDVTFTPDVNDPDATIHVSAYGIYVLTWTVLHENCQASSDITVTFHEPPIAVAGPDQELNHAFSTTMEAELSASETGVWSLITGSGVFDDITSPVSAVSGLSTGTNQFLWTVSSEYCSASDSVSISVNDLFVPQVITPNGDNKNDFFVIRDIEKSGPAELIIFNRWGNEVYYSSHYLNEWNGTRNNGTELPDDTYYYVLNFAKAKMIKGFIIIKR